MNRFNNYNQTSIIDGIKQEGIERNKQERIANAVTAVVIVAALLLPIFLF